MVLRNLSLEVCLVGRPFSYQLEFHIRQKPKVTAIKIKTIFCTWMRLERSLISICKENAGRNIKQYVNTILGCFQIHVQLTIYNLISVLLCLKTHIKFRNIFQVETIY